MVFKGWFCLSKPALCLIKSAKVISPNSVGNSDGCLARMLCGYLKRKKPTEGALKNAKNQSDLLSGRKRLPALPGAAARTGKRKTRRPNSVVMEN